MRPGAIVCVLACSQLCSGAQVLLFTRTTGYRHDAIPIAIAGIGNMSARLGMTVTASEDPAIISDSGLSSFDAVIFALNSEPDPQPSDSPMLSTDQQAALARYFAQPGKGFVGIHSASACLYHDSNYTSMLGAAFDQHASLQPATFVKTNASSQYNATASLPAQWRFEEEVYAFSGDPRSNNATVILSVDESSYSGYKGNATLMGSPHPIAWLRDVNSSSVAPGRMFYTSLGHQAETWSEPTFLAHVQNGSVHLLGRANARSIAYVLATNASSVASPTASSTPAIATSQTNATVRLEPTGCPVSRARIASTIEVTGWFWAKARTGPGMVAVGTNAELMNGRKING